MKELTVEEKIAEIKNTNSYQDVKNSWFPPYHEKEYYFVSYSHKDYKLVYESLHRLQSGEKRLNLWYDHSLTPGRDWEIEARRYIYDFNCKGVIFFVSENAVLSQSIHKEIEFVKNSGKSYLSINLPCEKIEGHIGEYLSAAKILELLKQQGSEIENYDEKSAVLSETFNDKITFLPLNEDIDSQTTKILALKREPLLNIKYGAVVAINDMNAEEIKEDEFAYWDEKNEHLVAHTIDICAFANCQWLKKVDLPNSISCIEKFAFYNCYSLISLKISINVFRIGDSAFSGCTSLKSVTIPNSVTSIGDSAFCDCTNLNNVKIPDRVTSIGNYSFYGCTSLKSVIIGRGVKSIGNCAFYYCISLESVTIPNSVTFIGDSAFVGCSSLESIIVDPNNQYYSSQDGILYNKAKTKIIRVPQKKTNVTINSSVEYIGDCAFCDCINLKNITIPDGTTSIGEDAFSGCTSLKSVTMGRGVKSIGNHAFLNCESLERITIPQGVTSIGNSAFQNCTSLECVTIPKNVKIIDSYAFEGCRHLKNIYYKGTKQEWRTAREWCILFLDVDYVVHCTDGDLGKGEF